MKISRRSWHYRLLLRNNLDPPDNLCGYFWLLLVVIFLRAFVAAVYLFFLSILALLLWGFIDKFGVWRVAGFGLGVPACLVFLVIGACRVPSVAKRFSNTIPGQWLRAKKDRVCPTIEWTE
jgi:hypothetical protein